MPEIALDPLLASAFLSTTTTETPTTLSDIDVESFTSFKLPDEPETKQEESKSKIKLDEDSKTEGRKKNPNWRTDEDKSLCMSWLNTSRDAVIGSDQTSRGLWERIHKTYEELIDEINEENKNKKGFKPYPARLQNALECRWATIQLRVNKFCGFYQQIERRLASGKSRDDIMAEAKELYKSVQGSAFTLDHCWIILAQSPKWQNTMEELSIKNKSKNTPKKEPRQRSTTATTTDVPDSDISVAELSVLPSDAPTLSNRPNGRKQEKKKRKLDALEPGDMAEGQKELIEISRQKLETMQTVADDAIMGRDLTGLDEDSLAYYAAQKKKILARLNL